MQLSSLPVSLQVAVYGVVLVIAWLLLGQLRSILGRQALLLAVSYILYATWGLWFLLILVSSSLMNYGLGVFLRRKPSAGRLWIGILLNLVLLSVFKYLPLAAKPSHSAALAALWRFGLPIGISFWTFEALSYLFDLYREEDLDPTLLEFCLYMSFWPTVLSGPICRLPEMLPQFREYWSPCWRDVSRGAQRIATGLIMIWLSEILASGVYLNTGVDHAFSLAANSLGGMDVWMMIVGYGFQLFFNFCGYSHVVIGAAQLFGFRLAENFNHPYLSTTPSEFWTRWHMSLSFWIRDYVFFPLATRRAALWWRNLSLVIAMFLFGLWHKGSVLFICWGIYHGLLLVGHRYWQQSRAGSYVPTGLLKPLSWTATFAGISLGWIFFRAESLHSAAVMLRTSFSPAHFFHRGLPHIYYLAVLVLSVGYFAVIAAGQLLERLAPNQLDNQAQAFAGPGNFTTRNTFRVLAQNCWVWLTPALSVLTLYLYVLLKPQVTAASPMLYRVF